MLGGVAAVLGLVLAGALSDVMGFLTSLKPVMNGIFYWMMFAVFGIIFLIAFIGSRLDYWEIEPNEIVHRYGMFRRMRRFSTESLRWDKVIPDVMERIMLGTGTIEQMVQPPYLIMDGRRMIPDYKELVERGYSYIAVGSPYLAPTK